MTAAGTGAATITATSEGKSTTATIIVGLIPVAEVTVSPSTAELPVGSSIQLSAVLKGDAGEILTNRAVSWTRSTPTVARVSEQGLVTGVAPGTTTITATSEGKSATATITVPPLGSVASVAVSPPTMLLENRARGSHSSLVATVRDAAGNALSGHTVLWSSSDDAVATVSSTGLVLGRLYGQATITASAEGTQVPARSPSSSSSEYLFPSR